VDLPAGILPPGTIAPVVTVRQRDFGVVNGTVALPVDLSGEIWHALRAAQAGYRGEAARLWATRLEEDFAVVRAYYDLLAAERLREVTEQTVALQREQVNSANDLFTHGRLTKNGLLIAQVALTTSEQRLRARDLEIDQARRVLNQEIGRDVNAPTRIAEVRDRPQLPSESEVLEATYAENPLLKSLLEEQQRLEETATALARGRLPRLNAGGAIDYSSAKIVEPQTVGSGFVGFSWDLGTDTRREAQIAQARIEAEQNRIRVERQIRELEAAVRNAYEATGERLSALAAATEAVGQADENLRIRREQFDVGRAQSEDVLDAQAVLAHQRATLATSLYEAQVRRAELQRLMGRSLDELLLDPGGR
jgi:outer membrane protein TolC